MTLLVALSLFAAMVVLAVIPGPGIMIVVARTLSQGLMAGAMTSLGIVAGDFVFIVLAVYGLSAMSEFLGGLFLVVKYAGAAYLIWLGVKVLFASNIAKPSVSVKTSSHSKNFAIGLFTTLSNPKAILFYVSFFPAFLDLSKVTIMDFGVIFLVAFVAVGGVMMAYACLAWKTGGALKASSASRSVEYCASATLISSGIYVATRASE